MLRRGRVALADRPAFAPLLVRVTGGGARRDLSATTQLVIEGFPRSGNTFAVEAFRAAQPHDVPLSSHVHTPAQVVRAVRGRIPVLLVVRAPLDAAASMMLAAPYMTARGALYEWIRFHRRLVDHREDVVVATFDQITQDMGAVIERVNARYRTPFATFVHDRTATERVFAKIESNNAKRHGGHVSERDAARPSSVRAVMQQEAHTLLTAPRLARRRDEAGALYSLFAAAAQNV